jgi:hypothetical protein
MSFYSIYMASKPDPCNGFSYLGKKDIYPLVDLWYCDCCRNHTSKRDTIWHVKTFLLLESYENSILKKKTTLVGTMRRNRRKLPPAATATRTQALHGTKSFTSTERISLTVCKAKSSRNVVILSSSRHEYVTVDVQSGNPKKKLTQLHFITVPSSAWIFWMKWLDDTVLKLLEGGLSAYSAIFSTWGLSILG